MLFDGLSEVVEMFRGSIPLTMLYFVPLILMLSNDPRGMGVSATQDFQVYRMQQFDMPFGTHLGSRSNAINMEARTIHSKSASISRRCVLIKLVDFTLERYRILVSQYVGAIIVILPLKYDQNENRQSIKQLEGHLLHEEVKLPVYFVPESTEINDFYDYIEDERTIQADASAVQAIIDSVVTNGFQFVINSAQSQPLVQSSYDFQAVNIQGRLNGRAGTSNPNSAQKIPTIIITAHYDAIGMATSLSYGCDSNGSGVAALLELSRLFSYLYANLKTVAAVNIVFVLTAEGKFNYHGTKKWLEEHSETHEIAGKVDLDDVLFAICLDSLSSSENNEGLYMHVSRPPKEGQASFEFLKNIEKVANQSNVKFEMIHKKINLATEMMAWEHERFSLNKIPAMTLSHFQNHKDLDRTSMTDTINNVNKKAVIRNIKVIAQSIAQYMYRNEDITGNLFSEDLNVSEEFISSWLDNICQVPRTASLLNKNNPLVNNFYSHFSHYLQETVKYPVKVQIKEPEFVFYNEEKSTLVIYNVKPAVFDLFLALLICGYLGLVYLFVLNFHTIFSFITRSISSRNNSKSKAS